MSTILTLPFIEPPRPGVRVDNVAYLRSPAKITSIVLHQNGFRWKPTNRMRWKIRAHAQMWADGTATQIVPLEARLKSSSNSANAHCIAIEFDGNFEGEPGQGNFWNPEKFGAHHLTSMQCSAGRAIISECVRIFPSIRNIYAHRQWGVSKKGKPNKHLCPGHEIWTHVGEWAIREFGLSDGGPGWRHCGVAIPDSWRGEPMCV